MDAVDCALDPYTAYPQNREYHNHRHHREPPHIKKVILPSAKYFGLDVE
jgi:hypothetical protein